MKYQPGLPSHNDNVSKEHPFKDLVTILGGLSVIALVGFWLLGLAIDMAVERLSPESTAQLDRALARAGPPPPARPDATELRLQTLMDQLAHCAVQPTPGQPTASAAPVSARVQLSKASIVNAAAFQGGSVVVFQGLLDKMSSENGLAFVLAHELAHLQHRDHLRGLGRGVVVLAVAVALGADGAGTVELLEPVLKVGTAGYSRQREALADAAALRILNCHYGHVGGATELFEVLGKSSSKESLPFMHYFDSHPAVQARIDHLHQLAKERGYGSQAVRPLGAWAAPAQAR